MATDNLPSNVQKVYVTNQSGGGGGSVTQGTTPWVSSDATAQATLASILSALSVTQGASLGSNVQTLIGGSVTTSAPTYTTGKISPLSLDTTGALRVNVTAGGGANASIGTDGATGPGSSTQIGAQDGSGNLQPLSVDASNYLNVNVAASGTLPVSGAFYQATQPVSGTFYQATQPVSGTFYQATQPVSGTFWQATQPISGSVTATGPLTDAELRATPVPVSGTVSATVSGTVTATGPLTDTQLRATAVPVSGTVSATVSGTVTATGPLTDTQLRATAVPISGTVTATGPLTDTQLRATAVPVSGTVTANIGSPSLGQATAANSLPVVTPSNMPLATSGGCSISRTLSAANTTGISVKGSAGQVYGIIATNTNSAARFVKLYNVSSTPTVGTTVPVMTLVIPGNSVGAGMVIALECGVAFGTGIGLGITGLIADNDTTAPAANEVVVHVLYA